MVYGKSMTIVIAAVCFVLAGVWFMLSEVGNASDVPRMTTEELKSQLDNPNITILDVRAGGDWNGSEWKVKGAIREDPKNMESWMGKYSKDKTLVLYCA